MPPTLHWDGSALVVLDQTLLPAQVRTARLTTVDDVIDAIRRLVVRGAPLIGVTGAFGVVLAGHRHRRAGGGVDGTGVDEDAVRRDADRIVAARPTAVNLRWAVERVLARLPEGAGALEAAARALREDTERAVRAAARRGADVVVAAGPQRPLRVLTHCNTGDLATLGGGTALGTVRALAADGRIAEVLATETRPLLQGARLTVWELADAGVPHRLCVDAAAPAAVAAGLVDAVVVGADRIAANGDTANKVGTYALACAAARSGVPFVVVAPESTVDPATPSGAAIPIEERAAAEVTRLAGADTTVPGTRAYNPAFDVTPADLITAIATEDRVWRPAAPYR